MNVYRAVLLSLMAAALAAPASAQPRPAAPVDTYVTVTGASGSTGPNAQDEAIADALRTAVEQTCGVFIRSQSKTDDYQAVYDKVLANTAGYVLDYKVLNTSVNNGQTTVRVTAHVSTVRFQEEWARIAHTLHQENNPRVIVAIGEGADEMTNKLSEQSSSSSTDTTNASYESESFANASRDTLVQRFGESNVWTDERGGFWYWRQGHAYCASQSQVSSSEQAAADAHFRAAGASTSSHQGASDRQVWESIARSVDDKGVVQGKIEDFLLEKGLKLVDRDTTEKVSKRDLALAVAKNDPQEIRALGARFHADVFILGTASAKFARQVDLGDTKMFQYSAKLVVRAVRADSGEVLVSKVFGPVTVTSTLQGGGEAKALAKLAQDSAPRLLAALMESWRKQVNVSRSVELTILGMDRKAYKAFAADAADVKGMQNVRLRELTESMATVDIEYKFDINLLADKLESLPSVKLEVTEQNANRLKLKVVK